MRPEDLDKLLVDKPEEGRFEVSRHLFNDAELFELEMKYIFEASWVFLCHESQIANSNDYFLTHIGRQPVMVTRDEQGEVNAFINACPHRGATLCRTAKGNQKFVTCPYHGWVFDMAGKNVEVKDLGSGAYPDPFLQQSHDLAAVAKVASYKGFVFGSLSDAVPDLKEHLGQTMPFIDMLDGIGPDGIEVLRGHSTYVYAGNWKMQTENGIDGYHFTSVHMNYVGVLQRRLEEQHGKDAVKSGFDKNALNGATGCYDLGGGHAMIWSTFPMPENRPLWQSRDEVTERMGPERAEWMLTRQRNVLVYPNINLMEQASSQIRVWRPISHDLTEVKIYCIAPVGEAPEARQRRIRQYEDFFNATGMATPDDLSEFEACQVGFTGYQVEWQQGYDRGLERIVHGPDEMAQTIGLQPIASGPDIMDEILYHGQYRQWHKLVGKGLTKDEQSG
ncbi:MAG TPA: benzoate 1,2-dioxygenase large subunit [Gammaproteobacteria bacterium]|nr:benzoate 1,2-dioxygenase large subunit [Gammaproteobacteria bacterium]